MSAPFGTGSILALPLLLAVTGETARDLDLESLVPPRSVDRATAAFDPPCPTPEMPHDAQATPVLPEWSGLSA